MITYRLLALTVDMEKVDVGLTDDQAKRFIADAWDAPGPVSFVRLAGQPAGWFINRRGHEATLFKV